MDKGIVIRGGARIGLFNASWPFAKLEVLKGHLILKVALKGIFNFKKEDIVSLEPMRGILSNGIAIKHSIKNCEDIIFWTFRNPKN